MHLLGYDQVHCLYWSGYFPPWGHQRSPEEKNNFSHLHTTNYVSLHIGFMCKFEAFLLRNSWFHFFSTQRMTSLIKAVFKNGRWENPAEFDTWKIPNKLEFLKLRLTEKDYSCIPSDPKVWCVSMWNGMSASNAKKSILYLLTFSTYSKTRI